MRNLGNAHIENYKTNSLQAFVLKFHRFHPYEIKLTQELNEYGSD